MTYIGPWVPLCLPQPGAESRSWGAWGEGAAVTHPGAPTLADVWKADLRCEQGVRIFHFTLDRAVGPRFSSSLSSLAWPWCPRPYPSASSLTPNVLWVFPWRTVDCGVAAKRACRQPGRPQGGNARPSGLRSSSPAWFLRAGLAFPSQDPSHCWKEPKRKECRWGQ